MNTNPAPASLDALRLRHLRFGWWSLLLFALTGITLEALHGFKVDWYLDVGSETRRLMWRLAHAHGTFLAVINLVFAATLAILPNRTKIASPCLIGASIAIPGGFFLGGLTPHSGDPGIGILLLPLGAFLLVTALLSTALATRKSGGH
ncbi:MAG: hypothetical protein VYE77_11185 [Planctomycetota bacterium]|nr:hypothetical protein [Planctomycetota bacterium]